MMLEAISFEMYCRSTLNVDNWATVALIAYERIVRDKDQVVQTGESTLREYIKRF